MTQPVPVKTQPSADSGRSPLTDLEIKDAHVIFQSVWHDLEAEYGHEYLRFPKEIILLGGAPGRRARGPTRRSSPRRAA